MSDASAPIDLLDAPEDAAFRAGIRAFVAAQLAPETRRRLSHGAPPTRDDILGWHRRLAAQGWAAPAWPVEHGGPGWTPRQRLIFEEECFRGHAPPLPGFGLKMIGPVLMRFGTKGQRDRFLPGILSGADWWCQGFSEPGAGSDLAGLRTRAERTEGGWIVDGGKTWTTYAQYANWMFCLVRTNPEAKKQEGISMMLIGMDDPGVKVQPIRLADGTEEVNSVFLDRVFVPEDRVVGEIDRGWTTAKYLLEHERFGIGGIGRSKHALARARALAAEAGLAGAEWVETALAELEIDLLAMEATTLRLLAREEAGATLGAETSLLKIRGTEIQQKITETMLQIAGPLAAVAVPPGAGNAAPVGEPFAHVAYQHLNWRKLSIYGGSNEIQRQIIAKQVLGL